jgi:NAD(P)H-dependent flavin oxidoreductase YrpB (nitropropane dioxygenase family)
MEAAIALTGQVAGRVDSIETVADIITSTITGFRQRIREMQGV